VDVEHQPTDLAVGGSNPSRRASNSAAQRPCDGVAACCRATGLRPNCDHVGGHLHQTATTCDHRPVMAAIAVGPLLLTLIGRSPRCPPVHWHPQSRQTVDAADPNWPLPSRGSRRSRSGWRASVPRIRSDRSTRALAVEEAAVHARRLQALAAEGAGAVGEGERHHQEVAWLDVAHLGADVSVARIFSLPSRSKPPGVAYLMEAPNRRTGSRGVTSGPGRRRRSARRPGPAGRARGPEPHRAARDHP
jgi:hypothetical protein